MISFCIIGKNEEKNVDKCLSALSSYGYEIVFVDTGSTDRTKEIVQKYTDKVYDFEWIDDFAAAKNYSASLAGNEYVITIDCDEVVTELDKEKTEMLIQRNPAGIGRLLRINEFTREDDVFCSNESVSRLYSKKLYHYVGTIHEQLVRLDGSESEFYHFPLTMKHSGYEGSLEDRRKKTERNRKLLLAQLKKTPDDSYILYQLGKTYYMEQDYGKSAKYLGKALEYDVNPKLEYVQECIETYGYSLVNMGEYEKALGLSGVYEEFAVSADFVFLMGLIYMNNGMLEAAVGEFEKATQMSVVKVHGTNSFRAYYNIGVIYECTARAREAERYYKLAGDFEPAKEGLKRLEIVNG